MLTLSYNYTYAMLVNKQTIPCDIYMYIYVVAYQITKSLPTFGQNLQLSHQKIHMGDAHVKNAQNI